MRTCGRTPRSFQIALWVVFASPHESYVYTVSEERILMM